jgi:hypothetical protein
MPESRKSVLVVTLVGLSIIHCRRVQRSGIQLKDVVIGGVANTP